MIHHTATLTLLSFSWISNYIRIGTLVMAVHDCSDILLEVSTHTMYLPAVDWCHTFVAIITLTAALIVLVFPPCFPYCINIYGPNGIYCNNLWFGAKVFGRSVCCVRKGIKYINVGPVFVFQGAKVFNYAKWHQAANGIFVVFTVVFMVSRIIIFPFW